MPGARIREHLAAAWPVFRQLVAGRREHPPDAQARARLAEHVPELRAHLGTAGGMIPGDSGAAAALALWNPPPFLTGCSQAAVLPGGPALIRHYDWDYRLFDGVVARTTYTGRRVVGMLDCLWGLLDGDQRRRAGRLADLRRRPQVGEGFGIPLVIRYVLEVCGTVDEAMQVLCRVPVHMSYNVTAWTLRPVGHGVPGAGRRPASPARPWPLTIRARWNGRRMPRRSAAWSARSALTSCWPPAHRRLRRHRSLPAVPALRHPLRRGLRHPVHRRVPARRGRRTLPQAEPGHVAVVDEAGDGGNPVALQGQHDQPVRAEHRRPAASCR